MEDRKMMGEGPMPTAAPSEPDAPEGEPRKKSRRPEDAEIQTIRKLAELLDDLDVNVRPRVLAYLTRRYAVYNQIDAECRTQVRNGPVDSLPRP